MFLYLNNLPVTKGMAPKSYLLLLLTNLKKYMYIILSAYLLV